MTNETPGSGPTPRPTRAVARVKHSKVGDLTIKIEGVGTAVASTYAQLPDAVEQLRDGITSSYDHDAVTIIFPPSKDPVGRHGNQRFIAASSWPGGGEHDPNDPRDLEHGRELLVTAHDDGQIGVHVVRQFGDGPARQVIRVDAEQGGWIAELLGSHPESHLEHIDGRLRLVNSADWRAAMIDRLARCWEAHPGMSMGQLLASAVTFAATDPDQVAVKHAGDLDTTLGDLEDAYLAEALDRYVSVLDNADA